MKKNRKPKPVHGAHSYPEGIVITLPSYWVLWANNTLQSLWSAALCLSISPVQLLANAQVSLSNSHRIVNSSVCKYLLFKDHENADKLVLSEMSAQALLLSTVLEHRIQMVEEGWMHELSARPVTGISFYSSN